MAERTWKDHELHGTLPPLRRTALAIFLLLCVYGIIAAFGIPQHWTHLANEKHDDHHGEHVIAPVDPAESTPEKSEDKPHDTEHHGTEQHDGEHHNHEGHVPTHGATETSPIPPYYTVIPFVLLLVAIAALPLIPAAEHWWHSNLNKFYVAGSLGILTLLYYGFLSDFTLEGHWPCHFEVDTSEPWYTKMSTIFGNAIIDEFIPFIVLLFTLYVIAGGIRIEGNFKATPMVNSMIFAVGAVIANFFGTTGAAMLLIRLLLDTNRERKHKVHTIVFFIFIVCNNGGCLTPFGDPPLFLGYLRGVDFFWTIYLVPYWLFTNSALIFLFFMWDTLWYYPKESKADKELDAKAEVGFSITGLKVNLPLLLGVIVSVAFLSPTNPVPVIGTFLFPENDGKPWYFLREAIQLGLAALSLLLSSHWIRRANAFSFTAILEVAALFFGIFICMQAPLQILTYKGKDVVAFAQHTTGLNKPADKPLMLFWTTGALSCWLDNAPTYVVFFEVSKSLQPKNEAEIYDENGARLKAKLLEVGIDGATLNAITVREWQELVAPYEGAKLKAALLGAGADEAGLNAALEAVADEQWKKWLAPYDNQKFRDDGTKLHEFADGKYYRCTVDPTLKLIRVKTGFVDHIHLIAIAIGTVFMGGMTYIANGPNFMVKAIAEQSKIKMPSFFGFMVYSCLILLPLYLVMTIFFLPWMEGLVRG